MPKTVTLKKRTVILDAQCNAVLNIYQTVLEQMKSPIKQDDPALSSVHASDEKPSKEGVVNKAKQLAEQVFEVRLGANQRELSECSAEMDVGSSALFTSYRDYWVAQLREGEGISAEQMQNNEIEDHRILIMEFYLRLAMQALRWDSPLRSDQERKIFIGIISNFSMQLSKNLKLGETFRENLFEAHGKWLEVLVDTAHQIDQMTKAKPVLEENLKYLESLIDKLKRYLILYLTRDSVAKKDMWRGTLSTPQLNQTLMECENRILSPGNPGKKESKLTIEGREEKEKTEHSELTVKERGEREAERWCLVVQRRISTPNQSSGISETDLQLYDLVGDGIVTKEEARRQNKIIELFQGKSLESKEGKIKYLYGLWNKTRIVYQFLGQIDSLVQLSGWLPLLFHVVELKEVDNAIRAQISLCKKAFEICRGDTRLFKTPLGKELQESHTEIDIRNDLPLLGTLQDPELLRAVLEKMSLDFGRLTKLGTLLGCEVKDPFMQKHSKLSGGVGQVGKLIKGKPSQGKSPRYRARSLQEASFTQWWSSSAPQLENKISIPLLSVSDKPPKVPPFKSFDPQNLEKIPDYPSFRSNRSNSDPFSPPLSRKSSDQIIPTMEGDTDIPQRRESSRLNALALAEVRKGRESPASEERIQTNQRTRLLQSEETIPTWQRTRLPLVFGPQVFSTLNEPTLAQPHVVPTSILNESPPPQLAPGIPVSVPEARRQTTPLIPIPDPTNRKPRQSVEIEMVVKTSSKKTPEKTPKGKKTRKEKSIYPAKVSYLKAFVTDMRLSEDEITAAANTFNCDENYFFNANHRFSPFRSEVVKLVKDFSSSYLGLLEPQGQLFDLKPIWQERTEELAILKCLCIGSRDDARLILFIERMRTAASTPAWPKSKYNILIDNLKELLVLYHKHELVAVFESNLNEDLLAETEIFRKKYGEIQKENARLVQEVEYLKGENTSLKQENQGLKTNQNSAIKSLMAEVGKLKVQVTHQGADIGKHDAEIQGIKTGFGSFFKSEPKIHSHEALQQQSRGCNIL